MERIGIAASKIAKGNLFLYNFFVFLITFLFSLLVFLISGCSIVMVLVVIAYLTSPGSLPDLQKGWIPMMVTCMEVLAFIIGILALCAIVKNIKFGRK